MFTRWSLAIVAICSALFAGCSSDDDGDGDAQADRAGATTTSGSGVETSPTGAFVGTVEGSDAYVGLVAGPEGDALAYVTDGASSVDWLDGRLEGDAGTLRNDGGAIFEVTFTGDGASGTFTRPGFEPLTFAAAPAEEPAGIYRAEASYADGDYVGGWVVLPDATQRGAVRRYETPLPPGTVDAFLDLNDPVVTVPGGVLMAVFVDPLGELQSP